VDVIKTIKRYLKTMYWCRVLKCCEREGFDMGIRPRRDDGDRDRGETERKREYMSMFGIYARGLPVFIFLV
jgi:hypothetical protein